MCGNGARCYGRFAQALVESSPETLSFETVVGELAAKFDGDLVEIAMSDPFDLELEVDLGIEGISRVDVLNTGVPHVVIFVDDLEGTDVISLGREIRNHAHFAPAGTNVNFAKVTGDQHIAIRTYERGVEGETLACGTGMIDVKGGDTLEIGFVPGENNSFSQVTLKGPADFVFTGQIEI